jgi:DNA end-binding protein Ku
MILLATPNRVNRVFIDSHTEEHVAKGAQTKGFGIETASRSSFDPDEVAGAIPASNNPRDRSVHSLLQCLLRQVILSHTRQDEFGCRCRPSRRYVKITRCGYRRTVLFRRLRTAFICPTARLDRHDAKFRLRGRPPFQKGYRRSAKGGGRRVAGSRQALHLHKEGEFDPASFDDRHESALTDL